MPTKIAFVGEAWGEQEARLQSPFVGAAGQELARMLFHAGYPCQFLPYNFSSAVRMLSYWNKFPYPLLSVFNARPPENNVEFFYAKPNTCEVSSLLPSRRIDNAIHHLKLEYESHVIQLHETLKELKPNVIVTLGNTALWALGLPPSISKLRGNVVDTPFGKVLPTFHPASVLRNWSQRIVTVLDLHKALRESEYPEVRTLSREIWTQPSIEDLYKWWELYGSQAELLAFDIETIRNSQISEISFAADSTHALHVPFFWKESGKFVNWWPDAKTEFEAWRFVKIVLESDVPKIGQNCMQYDSYWLAKEMKIGVKNITHDTMQMSHAWALELEKSLGFLGSIFLDERSWKGIRNETSKQND
jgi:uracil-DNA glycosylase